MRIKLNILALALLLGACADRNVSNESQTSSKNVSSKLTPLVEKVLSAEEQAKLTPEDVLKSLIEGNTRFVTNTLTARDHSAMVREATNGQFPKAVILSCLDSRIPVEDVFDKGIGDLFVARVAGNFVNQDILGSMEFGTKVAGAKLILVMGHENCGAIKAAVDNVQLGNITGMLKNIRPVLAGISISGETSSANAELVHKVCEANVKNTIENIRTQSTILAELEKEGKIMLKGAIYDMDSGKVEFL